MPGAPNCELGSSSSVFDTKGPTHKHPSWLILTSAIFDAKTLHPIVPISN